MDIISIYNISAQIISLKSFTPFLSQERRNIGNYAKWNRCDHIICAAPGLNTYDDKCHREGDVFLSNRQRIYLLSNSSQKRKWELEVV